MPAETDPMPMITAALDFATEGILVADGSGTVIACNAKLRRALGEESPLVSKSFTLILAKLATLLLDGKPFDARVRDLVVDRDVAFDGEFSLRDGRTLSVSRRRLEIDGTGPGQMWMVREVDSARGALQQAGWLATVVHDIRTPMNTVLGAARVLKGMRLEDEHLQLVEMIERSGHTALVLIGDILDLERLEAGSLDLNPEPVDLDAMVEDLVRDLAVHATSNAVALVVRNAPDSPRRVWADPTRLCQVLANLTGNALKFTEVGEVAIRISREATPGKEDVVVFTVSDTGPGIAPDLLPSLFEPFVRGARAHGCRGGNGLGLSIVKRIVDRMGGEIAVESELGRGTRFTVRLPLPIAGDSPRAESLWATPPRVLLAEASDASVAERLRAWGASVSQIADRHAIGTRLPEAGADYDVVLVDVRLDEARGLAILDNLQETPEILTKTIVLLPLEHRHDDVERLARSGVAAWVTTPLKSEQLYAAIEWVRGNHDKAI